MFIHESGPYNGTTIFFLHGNGADGRMWNTHMQALSDDHCLAPGKENRKQ